MRLKQYKHRLMIANLIAIAATLVTVPIPLILPIMVDEVLLKQPGQAIHFFNQILPSEWQSATGYIALAFIAVVLMRVIGQILSIVQSRQFTLVSKTITFKLRRHLLEKLGRISLQQYETEGSGGISSHLITDVETVDKFIGETLSRFVIGLLTILGTAVILLWLDWRLGLFILAINPIVVYLSKWMGSRVKHLKQAENKAFEAFQQRLVETLDGLYQLRAANRERDYLNQLIQDANQIRLSADQYAWQSEAAGRISFLCFLIGFELFRAVSMLMVIFSDLTIGQIFAVFGYLWFMLGPMQELLGIQFSWYGAKAALQRLDHVMQLKEEARPKSEINPFSPNEPIDVRIENLQFRYFPEQRAVIDNLSLTIPAGQKVALVGASGGGKSTLIQLLLGLYHPQSGKILYNGEPFERIGYDLLRSKVAVVLQQPVLFNDSLRQNLTLGADYPEDALWQALKIAQLDDVIVQLTAGLETPIGRQGVRLSGGQRQRLAIARLVLADPGFVILDEATSALDTATEAALHRAMQDFLQHRTTLIVAHRLSAVKQADHIYVLEDGHIVQRGTHHELVNQDGLYQTLYGSVQQE
ncbi:ABC transporter ATP-binding protein [Vibrio stylophorae]|nr:ABC transporter ATP-binding protein [Vibrio stylophorae]